VKRKTTSPAPIKSAKRQRETTAEKRVRHLCDLREFLQALANPKLSFPDSELRRIASSHLPFLQETIFELRTTEALRKLGHTCAVVKGGGL